MKYLIIASPYLGFLIIGLLGGVFMAAYGIYKERIKRKIRIPFMWVVRDLFNEEVYKKK